MTSVLKKKLSKGPESFQEDLPQNWGMPSHGQKSEDVSKFIKFIDENVIGKENSFCGPYGRRKVVYCDYSGSGRSLQWLEDHVARAVLPTHATRCTALSYTSGQSNLYRSESIAMLRGAVGAAADDVVTVGGSLQRFLRALKPQRVTLFVSSRETERQLGPWREFNAEIVKIPESKEGFIDLNTLESRLQEHTGTGQRMIGFFSAASKVTGVLADDVATTLLLHQYGAWAFWDYTLVAPTSAVDMNPTFPGVEEDMVKKDAVFFNCEKFVGGVQGPYVCVFKKDVFKTSPLFCEDVEALSERVEECRSADVVRAALVAQMRDAVGLQHIAERQDKITRQVLSHIKNIPELILLGGEARTVRRLPIFSLLVKHPRGTFLHHNFVCAVLNDVFGIQARGGLNSTLSYGQDVLGIDDQLLKEYEKLLDVEAQKEISRVRKVSVVKSPDIPIFNEHLRPGFCRVSLPFFMSEGELAFVLEALKMVATEGWKILPQYVVNPQTGEWRHHSCSILRDRKSLHSLRFHEGKMTALERRVSGPGIFPQTYTECLQTARNLFNRARKLAMKCSTAEPEVTFIPRIDYLRWFMLPKEAHDLLLGKSANVKHIVPFHPSGYTGARKSLNFARSSISSSPILGSSARHFSLSALDDCQVYRFKNKQKYFSRETSLKETHKEEAILEKAPPVQFAIGEVVSPVHLKAKRAQTAPILIRSRCYSLGSDSPPGFLSSQAKLNLGLKEASPTNITEKEINFCNCGSQTDLQSLDDSMISGKTFPYATQSSASISDCSQSGRVSPTASVTSHTSEDLQAYVKEMTREIATEIKSEIRGVISKVDDILENSEALDQSNLSINSISSQSDRNSISVTDVAEYLMGMSREMASEVKHEIREMVNQVDGLMSPDGAGSRRNSPPQAARARVGSGTELGLDLKRQVKSIRKCPTSPLLPTFESEDRYFKAPKSPKLDASGPSGVSFNSSETSTPETIIQMVMSPTILPKSLSSNKLSDEDLCVDFTCKHCYVKRNWSHPAGSSQDSGINMSFNEVDNYVDITKWRTSSDPTSKPRRRRVCPKHEKSEVPDIIEGVPVCPGELARPRVGFNVPADTGRDPGSKRSSRSSTASSSSRSSGYGTDARADRDDVDDDRSASLAWEEEDSSACSDSSLAEGDDGRWQPPPRAVWRHTLEAIQEYGMIRAGDKVLCCVSGSAASVALLHALRQYQLHARAQGTHFSIGALFVHESDSSVDPLHLMTYCRNLGVKLIYQDKVEAADARPGSKPLELHRWGSHAVRRRAYAAAAAHGYSVAAVAQHLDDAAAAFLASVFHGGTLATVKAHYRVREHELRIIRPFIYVRARELAAFAASRSLADLRAPPAGDDSKDAAASERCPPAGPLACARAALSAQERSHPHLYASLKSALYPLISSRNIEKDLKEHRHRKKSVIQMKNGAPVYDSDEGTEEEPVP